MTETRSRNRTVTWTELNKCCGERVKAKADNEMRHVKDGIMICIVVPKWKIGNSCFQASEQCRRNAKFVRWTDEHKGLLHFLFGFTSQCIVLAAVNACRKCSVLFWLKVISILWHGHMCHGVSLSYWQIEFSSFFMCLFVFVSLSFAWMSHKCIWSL